MGLFDIVYVELQAKMNRWSEDYKQVRLDGSCLNRSCKANLTSISGKDVFAKPVNIKFKDQDGNEVDESSPKATFFMCDKCQRQWTYKNELIINSSIVRIEEINIQALGTEESFIKNSSHAQVERRIEVSKQWVNSYSVLEEKVTKTSDSITLGLDKYSSFKSLCEETLKNSNSIFNKEVNNHQESLCITVPPHSSVRLKYYWKSKVFKGSITFINDLGKEIPELQTSYEVASGITLDLEVESLEINSSLIQTNSGAFKSSIENS